MLKVWNLSVVTRDGVAQNLRPGTCPGLHRDECVTGVYFRVIPTVSSPFSEPEQEVERQLPAVVRREGHQRLWRLALGPLQQFLVALNAVRLCGGVRGCPTDGVLRSAAAQAASEAGAAYLLCRSGMMTRTRAERKPDGSSCGKVRPWMRM